MSEANKHGGMPLYAPRDVDDLKEHLIGVEDKIKQVLEMHPSDDSDCHYVFVIWLNDLDNTGDVIRAIRKNIFKHRREEEDDWLHEVHNFDGLILIDSRL